MKMKNPFKSKTRNKQLPESKADKDLQAETFGSLLLFYTKRKTVGGILGIKKGEF